MTLPDPTVSPAGWGNVGQWKTHAPWIVCFIGLGDIDTLQQAYKNPAAFHE